MRVGLLSFFLAIFVASSAWANVYDEYAEGEKAAHAKRNDQVIQIFTAIIDSKRLAGDKERLAYSYFYRGQAYRRKNQMDKAIPDLIEATKLAPTFASSFFELGLAYHGQRKYDDAIKSFDKAIKLKPNDANYYYSRCVSHSWANRHQGVLADCGKALELKPGFLRALVLIGRAYEDMRNCDRAEDTYNRVLKVDPGNRSAVEGLAYIKELRESQDPKVKCSK